jgi:hypothetical protein
MWHIELNIAGYRITAGAPIGPVADRDLSTGAAAGPGVLPRRVRRLAGLKARPQPVPPNDSHAA